MSWSAVVGSYGVSEATTARLVGSLQASEAAALAFCRLLETWQRGEPQPCTPGRRQAALRRAAERAETALADLQAPLERFLLELEGDAAEGRPWYGEPGAGEVVEWEPVLRMAGVAVALRCCGAFEQFLGVSLLLLQRPQAGVFASRFHQLGVRAALDDAPLVEDQNFVRVHHRGEPVRDDERCSALGNSLELRLNGFFGARIERRSGLVEDQDTWIL